MKYSIYTDGSTKNNGAEDAIGGWGYVVVNTECNVMIAGSSGIEEGTTNQRMELMAAIQGIKAIAPFTSFPEDSVVIYTDSAYLHNCFAQKWYVNWQKNGWKNSKKEKVANRDLWEQLIPYFSSGNYQFEKVKGHSDNSTIHEIWNNYVDQIAQTAASNYINHKIAEKIFTEK